MPLLLKITLSGSSKPPIWRKILIDENASFQTLHDAIQVSFGWYGYHLWEFSSEAFDDTGIGPSGNDDPFGGGWGDEAEDAPEVLLSTVFKTPKTKFSYVYDMGDNWEHEIVLEKIVDEPAPFPQCVAGKGACPPEDCGGIYSYYELVETVNNPKSPDYEEMREWLGLEDGESWDVKAFDLEETQEGMKRAFS